MRTAVYIDGFNLYYAALKGTPHKWLDVSALCRAVLPNYADIRKIKYFTARVSSRSQHDNTAGRQSIYLKALQAHCSEVGVIYGHFSVHAASARMLTPGGKLAQKDLESKGLRVNKVNRDVFRSRSSWEEDPGPPVHIIKTEEKGTDVNLAVHMLNDAWKEDHDCFVVVSNDSDLAEAMRIVRDERQKTVDLIGVKGQQDVRRLRKNATHVWSIRPAHLEKSQLPETIPNTKYSKPAGW